MSRPKLRDVAALAGVSEPTVSRVLNGRSGVAAATKTRVVEALEELGWSAPLQPRRTRTGVVGIVSGEFSNPVFPTLVDAITTRLARSEFLTSVAVTAPPLVTEAHCIDELQRAGVDSIVLLGGQHATVDGDLSLYQQLIDYGIPVVLVNGRRTPLPVPHVICDEQAGSRKATAHLLSLGHRRIGCILGSSEYVPTARMVEGYHEAHQAAGAEIANDAIVATTFTYEGGMAGARRLIQAGFTAAVTANDLMALGAVSAAASLGREVPTAFSVVGYDGTPLTALTGPPLTTLQQPFDAMSKLIVEAIVSECAGSTRHRDHYVFEPELVARSTSGAPASGQ